MLDVYPFDETHVSLYLKNVARCMPYLHICLVCHI